MKKCAIFYRCIKFGQTKWNRKIMAKYRFPKNWKKNIRKITLRKISSETCICCINLVGWNICLIIAILSDDLFGENRKHSIIQTSPI